MSTFQAICKPFGGVHTILCGDFYQMKTMGGSSLIDPDIPHSHEEARKGSKCFKTSTVLFI